MNLLIKYPTRQRPEQFLKTLKEYYSKARDNSNIKYLVSYDLDDRKMNSTVIARAKAIGTNIEMVAGHSKSKIHACNRDIKEPYDWDILLLISDDMEVQVKGWDEIIRNKMKTNFPDTDGALWFFDGYQDRICTLSCVGRKYYERFNYLYHPDYSSLWSDNEFTEVAQSLGRMKYFKDVIIKHVHPVWDKKIKVDELYKLNEGFFHRDHEVYKKRKRINFGLNKIAVK